MPAKPPVKSEPEGFSSVIPNPSERRGISLFLRQTTEFRLALALYNDPVQRDALLRSLTEEMASEGIRVLTLDLREPSAERTLLARVEAITKGVEPGQRIAVMVVNLEGCVDYTPELSLPGSPGTAFLETANLHRDLFTKACPWPLVIWMTELLERALVRHAPDLWHWRSHIFDLRTRPVRDRMVPPQTHEMHSDDSRLHPEDRLRRLEEELAAYRKAKSRSDELRLLNAIGIARYHSGDARLARQDFEEALNIARELGNRYAEGASLGNLGSVYADLGDVHRAIEFHEQRRIIAREIGHRQGEGSALGNLGNAFLRLAEVHRAIEFYEHALIISREIGDRRGEGNVLWNSAVALDILGNRAKAIARAEEALKILEEVEAANADKVRDALAQWREE